MLSPTFPPPVPSTIFPVRVSTTLAWNQPPSALSSKLPMPPHKVIASISPIFACHPQPSLPSLPKNWANLVLEGSSSCSEQKGKKIDVTAIVKAPKKPANVPSKEIPPFVPGGTLRKFHEVNSLGFPFDRIPSSEEKVSAATAA